jgi:hypothetical protein
VVRPSRARFPILAAAFAAVAAPCGSPTKPSAPPAIRARFEQALGMTLEDAESAWLAFIG